MSTTTCSENELAEIVVSDGNRSLQRRNIQEGDRLVVGAAPDSDIVLEGEDVASTHCLLNAENGTLVVRDCYSSTGTTVNGQTVREKELTRNAEIAIGPYTLSVKLRTPQAAVSRTSLAAAIAATPNALQAAPPTAPVVVADPAPTADETPPAESVQAELHALQLELIQSRTENRILSDQLQKAQTPEQSGDPFQDEMIELLRAEVIDLQNTLSDLQSSVEQPAASQDVPDDGDIVSHEEAERLVNRLEQLLEELQERDDQIATLTELLEAAEGARDAEEAERLQVSSWLNDIEQRFGQREDEWNVERQKLESMLGQVAGERDKAELASNSENTDARLKATQEVLSGLRDTAEAQRQQLETSEKIIQELRQELETRSATDNREERIRLAEERAEIARQKQEIEAARHLASASQDQESALKLRALRQHLNEIHLKEQKEQEERKLSSRLSRLWKRMEGR